jgi:UDP-N-acetylglucosamine 2-epimerase (non-hydrolysing)
VACALVGAKELIPVAHIESGLRSFDRQMPEEVNRVVTDAIADLLFTTEDSAATNLVQEGIPSEKIFFTGNVMIDSLISALEAARRSTILTQMGLKPREYAVLTLHRPSNVDDPERLFATLHAISEIAQTIPVIFPIHPRTAVRVKDLSIQNVRDWNGTGTIDNQGIWTVPPASYLEFLCLMDSSAMMITDSGGIQEETTYLGIPCLTYRDNTERPVTITNGTNRLIGTKPAELVIAAKKVLSEKHRNGHVPPPLWDGHAAERIVSVIRSYLNSDNDDKDRAESE